MDHTTHTPLDATELNESNLLDAMIYGPDDEEIGPVSHVHGMGESSQVVAEVGGFLGMGAKSVMVNSSHLHFMRDENGTVHATTSMTKDELRALPEHHH